MQRQPGEGFRRAYVRPELTVHGDVGGVTHGVTNQQGSMDNVDPSFRNKTG
jgi:hypothetical protein